MPNTCHGGEVKREWRFMKRLVIFRRSVAPASHLFWRRLTVGSEPQAVSNCHALKQTIWRDHGASCISWRHCGVRRVASTSALACEAKHALGMHRRGRPPRASARPAGFDDLRCSGADGRCSTGPRAGSGGRAAFGGLALRGLAAVGPGALCPRHPVVRLANSWES